MKLTAKRREATPESRWPNVTAAAEPVIRASTSRARPRPIPCADFSRRRSTASAHVVEYEPDSDLRDTEQVPLQEPGGIEAFIRREVLPHAPDAWIDESKTEIGYEISFNALFLQAAAIAVARRDPCRHSGDRERNRGIVARIVGSAAQ